MACSPQEVQQCFECNGDGDCDGDLSVCRGGACIDVECQQDDQCDAERSRCVDNACIQVECLDNEDCAEGELCRGDQCFGDGSNRPISMWEGDMSSWDDRPPAGMTTSVWMKSVVDCQVTILSITLWGRASLSR